MPATGIRLGDMIYICSIPRLALLDSGSIDSLWGISLRACMFVVKARKHLRAVMYALVDNRLILLEDVLLIGLIARHQ